MCTIYYYVYRIRYRMFCSRKMPVILRSSTGPAHRNPSEDVEMDEDDQRDFEDYNYQPQEDDEDSDSDDFRLQRLVQILVDSMEFTADELESAVDSIPTPPVSVPDSGTSLKEAIEVHMCK